MSTPASSAIITKDALAGNVLWTLPTADGTNGQILSTNGSGALSWASAGGTGTVTSVSVTTANGVSGSVATATTTPAITLTLGAITPSSVAATGTVTGSNLSGTNTGDQTITLTGDVTGSGTGSFATTIATDAVTSAKILDGTIATADVANNAITDAKVADVLTLTNIKQTSGTTNGHLVPAVADDTFTLNAATQTLTNKTLTSPTLTTPSLGVATATSINKVTITAPASSATLTIADGKTLTASNSLTFAGTDGTTMTFPGSSDTVVTLTATQTLTNKSLSAPVVIGDVLAHTGSYLSPYGGIGRYQNVALYSQDFTQSGTWAQTSVTSVANNVTAPDGVANGAATITTSAANGKVAQTVSSGISASTAYVLSVWMKSGTSTAAQLELTGNGTAETNDTSAVTLTSSWQRFSVSHTTVANTTSLTATIKNTTSGSTTVLAWGGQLEAASGPGVYVKTTTTAVAASQGAVTDGTPTGTTSGTVTSVSVTTANGVSGSVATATTTPAITLTLGAITPSSVAATGTVTGSNLSGTNTGDQTITLTGDVTGSGTGSFATTIASGAVTLAKMANLAANSIIGNNTGSPATPIALTTAQTKSLLAIAQADVSGLTTASSPSFAGETLTGDLTLSTHNLVTDTTTGTKIGTGTTQKLGFYNATPIVQPSGNALTALTNLGLVASPTLAATDVGLGTSSTPQFARLGLGAAADATNIDTVTSTSTTANSKAVNVSHTGAITGTGYAGYFSKTGASTTNVGLYATATGATNNYAGIFEAGNVGIGTTSPNAKLDVLGTSRLGDSTTNYTAVSATGAMTFAGSARPKRTLVLTAPGGFRPSSGSAILTPNTLTNFSYLTLDFVDAATNSAYWQFAVPDSLDSSVTTVDVTLYWLVTGSVSGNVMWSVAMDGKGAAAVFDNSATLQTAISEAKAVGAANALVQSTITSPTSGWAPSETAIVKVSRLGADASDTVTASTTAKLLMIKLEWTANAESD